MSMQNSPEPRRRIGLALIPLLVFAILAAIFFKQLLSGGANSDLPSALIGKQAPVTRLEPLSGLTGNGVQIPGLDSAMFAGKVTIVNVWASWCVPCRQEHPLLSEMAADGRFQVTGINYKDASENALRFLGQLGNPFSAVGIDPRGRAAIEWGVYGVPETFIVGPDGTIAYKHVGPIDEVALRSRIIPEAEKLVRPGS